MTRSVNFVSVIMPAFNGEKYISSAIASALAQLDVNDELIVVDNASTDSTASIVKGFSDCRIKYQYERKRGAAAARNKAFSEMKGAFITFLDCDDLWPSGRQEGLLRCLKPRPEIDAAYGKLRLILDGGRDPRLEQLDGVLTPLVSLSCFMFRRSILEKTGEMDETLTVGEDTDYLIRLRDAGMRSIAWDGDVAIYRRHQANTTLLRETVSNGLLNVLNRKIHRNRNESK